MADDLGGDGGTLDTLGDDAQVEGMGHVDGGGDDEPAAVVRADRGDEGAVHLQLRHRQVAKVGQ